MTLLPSTDDILAASKVTDGDILTLKIQNLFKCQKSKWKSKVCFLEKNCLKCASRQVLAAAPQQSRSYLNKTRAAYYFFWFPIIYLTFMNKHDIFYTNYFIRFFFFFLFVFLIPYSSIHILYVVAHFFFHSKQFCSLRESLTGPYPE